MIVGEYQMNPYLPNGHVRPGAARSAASVGSAVVAGKAATAAAPSTPTTAPPSSSSPSSNSASGCNSRSAAEAPWSCAEWRLSRAAEEAIDGARSRLGALGDDLDLVVRPFSVYGKDFVKKCR
jgi:hypothetical protein